MEKRVHDKYHDRCYCGLRRGPHVFILSLLSLPFVWIYSTFQVKGHPMPQGFEEMLRTQVLNRGSMEVIKVKLCTINGIFNVNLSV